MTPLNGRRIFAFFAITAGFVIALLTAGKGFLSFSSHLDDALYDIESKDKYKDNEIKFELDPASSNTDD